MTRIRPPSPGAHDLDLASKEGSHRWAVAPRTLTARPLVRSPVSCWLDSPGCGGAVEAAIGAERGADLVDRLDADLGGRRAHRGGGIGTGRLQPFVFEDERAGSPAASVAVPAVAGDLVEDDGTRDGAHAPGVVEHASHHPGDPVSPRAVAPLIVGEEQPTCLAGWIERALNFARSRTRTQSPSRKRDGAPWLTGPLRESRIHRLHRTAPRAQRSSWGRSMGALLELASLGLMDQARSQVH